MYACLTRCTWGCVCCRVVVLRGVSNLPQPDKKKKTNKFLANSTPKEGNDIVFQYVTLRSRDLKLHKIYISYIPT